MKFNKNILLFCKYMKFQQEVKRKLLFFTYQKEYPSSSHTEGSGDDLNRL